MRIYEEETNLLCTLALDASGSMDFRGIARRHPQADPLREYPARQAGAPSSKLQYAQYLSSALAHVITRGQDQVGLALLDGRLRSMLPPGATLTHLNRLYASIEELVSRPTTVMAPGLRELFERCRRRGVLLLISDFLMDDLEDVFGGSGCSGIAVGKSSSCTWCMRKRNGCPRRRPSASRAWKPRGGSIAVRPRSG